MAAIAGIALTLSGCDDAPPRGQVLATIEGMAVTRRDVAVEMAEGRIGSQDQALRAVIARDLLVRAAQRRRLDRSPEYLGAVRRARDTLLVAQLETVLGSQIRTPSLAQAQAFVVAHPLLFAERQRLRVEQLIVSRGAREATALAGAASLDDADRRLRAVGLGAERTTGEIDTALVPEPLARRIMAARDGAPIRVDDAASLIVMTVTSRVADPVAGSVAEEAARAVMRRRQLDAAMDNLAVREQARTRIRYQNGFGPAGR